MKKVLLLLALLLLSTQVEASQNSTTLSTTSPYPGLQMLNDINAAFDTFQTQFSGASAPSSPRTWQVWVDTTANIVKIYNGSVWLPVGSVASSLWTPISNGVIATIPASTGSSNAYVVTYSPAVTALVVGQHYPFIANFSNTAGASENVNGLGAKTITKQGAVVLVSGDIANGQIVDTVWDGTEFQMTSQLANSAVGTVTSVATNNGLTGGTITASGTIGLATIGSSRLLANITGSTAVPTASTLTTILDTLFGSTQGGVLYRGASVWSFLSPGTNGQPLLTGGASANPSWNNLPVAAISASGSPSSSNFLRGDGSWQTVTSGFSSCTTVTATSGGSPASAYAACAGGYTLTGGGCAGTNTVVGTANPIISGVAHITSIPNSNGWQCSADSFDFNGTAYAVCCH